MNTMHKLFLPMLSFGLLAAGVLSGAAAEDLQVTTVGNLSYVSGGVGASEQEALQQAKADYNLQLLFAYTGSGAFLASVPVKIADKSGQVLLETVTNGPYLYAKVPAGSYSISAEHAGQVQTRTVSVPASGAASEGFYWAADR